MFQRAWTTLPREQFCSGLQPTSASTGISSLTYIPFVVNCHSLALSLSPPLILFPLESPFLSNSKKFPFHFKKKKKRIAPLSWTGKIFHRLERQSRRRMLSWSVVDIRAIRRSPLLFSRSRVRPPPCTEGHRANGTRGCSIITKIGRYTRRPKRRPVVGCMRVPERERERGEWRAYGQIIDRYRAAFICRSKTSYCEKRERGGKKKRKECRAQLRGNLEAWYAFISRWIDCRRFECVLYSVWIRWVETGFRDTRNSEMRRWASQEFHRFKIPKLRPRDSIIKEFKFKSQNF